LVIFNAAALLPRSIVPWQQDLDPRQRILLLNENLETWLRFNATRLSLFHWVKQSADAKQCLPMESLYALHAQWAFPSAINLCGSAVIRSSK
jgi:hypothetical protein